MFKGYISRWESRKAPETHILDYWFTSNPNSAWYWETKEEAESDCRVIFNRGIEIPSSLGGTYMCRDFKVDERKTNEFVVFCEAPFIPRV
jgi:hypothetical protein